MVLELVEQTVQVESPQGTARKGSALVDYRRYLSFGGLHGDLLRLFIDHEGVAAVHKHGDTGAKPRSGHLGNNDLYESGVRYSIVASSVCILLPV